MDNKLEISSHLNLVKSKTENRANKKSERNKVKKNNREIGERKRGIGKKEYKKNKLWY